LRGHNEWAFGERGRVREGRVNAAHRFALWKAFSIVHTGPAQAGKKYKSMDDGPIPRSQCQGAEGKLSWRS
jgi:hypothetical protein